MTKLKRSCVVFPRGFDDSKNKLTDIKCIVCCNKMIIRENKLNRHKYLACSNFPLCKETVNFYVEKIDQMNLF